MSRIRRVGALVAAATCTAAGVTAGATPAAADVDQGPRPLVTAVQYVLSGEPTWVRVFWKTRRDLCDARVTVSGHHVDVVYPDNTTPFTSFRRNATLAAGRADYTAFKVTVESSRSRRVALKATIAYTELPPGTLSPGVNPEAITCEGRDVVRRVWLKLPVIAVQDS